MIADPDLHSQSALVVVRRAIYTQLSRESQKKLLRLAWIETRSVSLQKFGSSLFDSIDFQRNAHWFDISFLSKIFSGQTRKEAIMSFQAPPRICRVSEWLNPTEGKLL